MINYTYKNNLWGTANVPYNKKESTNDRFNKRFKGI